MCGCPEVSQCLGVEHPDPDLIIISMDLISIATVTESQGGLG